MPKFKLQAPRAGKEASYRVRFTDEQGRRLSPSLGTGDYKEALKRLKQFERDYRPASPKTAKSELTFAEAARAYQLAKGGQPRIAAILKQFGPRIRLCDIDQNDIDEAAEAIKPDGTAPTKNREVYTPISAILKHSGVDWEVKRPKGWRGNQETEWLEPPEAFAAIEAATQVDREFGLLLRTLLYTGMRLSESLVKCRLARLTFYVDDDPRSETYSQEVGQVYVPKTKNGEPRCVFIPPHLVTALKAHPRGLERPGETLFRFRKNGRLYVLLAKAEAICGLELGFHLFRHTWAAWMRRAGSDTSDLLATRAWTDATSVRRYEHVSPSEAAKKASRLPTSAHGQSAIKLEPNIGGKLAG